MKDESRLHWLSACLRVQKGRASAGKRSSPASPYSPAGPRPCITTPHVYLNPLETLLLYCFLLFPFVHLLNPLSIFFPFMHVHISFISLPNLQMGFYVSMHAHEQLQQMCLQYLCAHFSACGSCIGNDHENCSLERLNLCAHLSSLADGCIYLCTFGSCAGCSLIFRLIPGGGLQDQQQYGCLLTAMFSCSLRLTCCCCFAAK